MINTERLCFGCMNDNGGENHCPICGFDQGEQNPEFALPIKFVINNKYLLGKVISSDDEGIKYIAWDNSTDSIVNIKEYFPPEAAHRNPDKTVSIITGKEYPFNEGLLEFAEIGRIIMNSDLPSLINVLDVFEENGTFYAVSAPISGITLADFLKKNGETLKWEQARPLFLPLIDTIKGMNDLGIIHRAISPETIYVGRDGVLKIADYEVKSVRTLSTELSATLYSGYAAVEQYGFKEYDTAAVTDVYGLAATLFRVFIGVAPPEAPVRLQNDVMTIPKKFAEELPRNVLAALANALQVEPAKRTKDIDVFKNELIYGELSVQKAAKVEKSDDISSKSQLKKKSSAGKSILISTLITVLVFAIIGAVLVFTVFKDDIFKPKNEDALNEPPPIEAPEVDQIGDIDEGAEVTAKLYSVPELKGKYYADIIEDDKYEMFQFVIIDKAYSDKYTKGMICAQSLEEGKEVERDTKIELTISLGSQEVTMPNLKGLTAAEAQLELLKQGFLYQNIEIKEKEDRDLPPETVVDQAPKFGDKVSTEIKATIYVNSYKPSDDAAGNQASNQSDTQSSR